MANPVPQGWFTGPAGMTPGQAEVGTEDSPWYLPGTGPATFTSGEGQDQTVGSRGPESIPQDMAWRQTGDQKYQVQQFGPEGLIGTASEVNTKDPNDALFGLLIQAGMAGVLGPLAGTLGAAVNTGLGLGLGSFGTTALGTALVNAGKTAAGGGDLGDSLKAGLTSGATSYLGSTIGDVLPKGVAPTGIKSLDTALTKGMQSAAGSGVTSLLTGNKNILQDALMAGAGAAAGSGVNSVISDAAGSTGLPPAALNIIGPAAIAELMGKDPTGAALKAAVGEITGAIKGSSPSAKAGAVGASPPTSQELNQLFDDGSSLDVTKKGGVSSTDTSDQRYAPGSNPFLQKNIDASAYQQDVAPFLSQAADNPLLPGSIRPEDRAYIEGRLKTGDDAKDVLADLVTAGNKQDYAERLFTAVAQDAPFPTEKEFEPSSGGSNQLLENAGLIQKDAAIPDQSSVLIQGEKPPSDFGLDFGAFAERPEATAGLDAAPQKVEVTGQTPDTELMRFLEANGLTLDEAQKVLVSGKTPTQDAGTDYNKFFELSGQEGPPTPKVVVQGQTPPKDTTTDDLMALLNQYDPKLDTTPRVDITGKLLQDMGLDLGAYYPGDEQTEVPSDKLTDLLTQTVPITGTKVKDELDPNFFYQPDEVAPDKLTDDLLQQIEITGTKLPDLTSLENVPEEVPDTPQVLIRDKLVDEPPWEDPWMPPVEQPPVDVVPPEKPVVKPVGPVVKPVVDPKRPVVPTTTTPGSSYTIPGTTTQLHQELMQLPETDILRMLNPALYAYKDAQKRKKLSQEDQMMALLNELGYRS